MAEPRSLNPFHALQANRNFRLFWLGQTTSLIGTWMQTVAQSWLVLQLTHSGVALGIDTALTFLPILLVGAWGGVIADRLDNRKLQIATQISNMVKAWREAGANTLAPAFTPPLASVVTPSWYSVPTSSPSMCRRFGASS